MRNLNGLARSVSTDDKNLDVNHAEELEFANMELENTYVSRAEVHRFVNIPGNEPAAAIVMGVEFANMELKNIHVNPVVDPGFANMINGNLNVPIVMDPKYVLMINGNLNVPTAEQDHLYVKRHYVAPLEIQNTTNTVFGVMCLCFQMIRLYEITRQKNNL